MIGPSSLKQSFKRKVVMESRGHCLLSEADFKLRHPESEADYTFETHLNYEAIKNEYWEESKELAERRPERKLKQRRNVSAMRIYSLYFYISWCIWITVVVIISALEPIPPGILRNCLVYTAGALICILPIVVCVESFFSREKSFSWNLIPSSQSRPQLNCIGYLSYTLEWKHHASTMKQELTW